MALAGVMNIREKESSVQAALTDNLRGWIWSNMGIAAAPEGIGWISLNSINCDSDGNGITDTGNYVQCPNGLPIGSYGLNINLSNGSMTGYAWSENIGWINFEPAAFYPSAPFYSARVDFSSAPYRLSGWARACSVFAAGCSGVLASNLGGWDGWIKLAGNGANPAGPVNCNGANDYLNSNRCNYGVYIDTSVNPAILRGYAYGGDIVGGWIKFNPTFGGGSIASLCGNNKIDVSENEKCDGTALYADTCISLGFAGGGVLSCNIDCTFDTSGCSGNTCGNGICTIDECIVGSECDADCNWNDCCGIGGCSDVLGEDCDNCPGDCGVCSLCGNGACDAGEEVSCPGDCPAGSGDWNWWEDIPWF